MSNRDKLRQLSRRFPGAEEVKGIIGGLSEESDRTAAIVGASLVESALEHLLVAFLKSKTSGLLFRLFDNRGPLSDLNSKILIGEAFGVITVQQAEELQRVRHIRNVFAHARIPVTFETPEIHKEVQEFLMLIAMKSVAVDPQKSIRPMNDLPSKAAYVLICHLIIIMLDHLHVRLGGKQLIT